MKSETLSPKQTAFLARLLTAKTVRQAAVETATPESTGYRWLASQLFQDALRKAKAEHLNLTMSVLAHASHRAIVTLTEALSDTSASVRVDAARVLLNACLKMADVALEQRLSDLETEHRLQKGQEHSTWEPHANNGRGYES